MEERLDSLQGQVHALSLLLTQLTKTLTPGQALEVAVELEAERIEALSQDKQDGTSSREADTRDRLLTAYVGLLNAVCTHG